MEGKSLIWAIGTIACAIALAIMVRLCYMHSVIASIYPFRSVCNS